MRPGTEPPPEAWFWAHDAQPDQIDSLITPSMRLIRLSRYGQRYAALLYQGSGGSYRIDTDATTVTACRDAVAITVGEGPRFSVVLGDRPTTVLVDLDSAGVRALAPGVVDIATYVVHGVRRYAVVVDPTVPETLVLTDITAREVHRLDEAPTRLRAHGDGRFTAVVQPSAAANRFWYAELNADDVARRLERHRAYPIDLDAVLTSDGVRFTVVMQSA